jgi:hypothetical protein
MAASSSRRCWLEDIVRNGRTRASATVFARLNLVFHEHHVPDSEGSRADTVTAATANADTHRLKCSPQIPSA